MWNRLEFPIILTLALMTFTIARADVLVETTFDSDRQDWSPGFPAGTGTGDFWKSTGGNPNGAVRSFDRPDPSAGYPSWFFGNSTTFNGDRSAAYNGTLTFDLRSNGSGDLKTNAAYSGSAYDVLMTGSITINSVLTSVFLAYVGLTAPTADVWTPYSLTLNETASGWHYNTAWFAFPSNWAAPTQAQFQGALSNISQIQIRGDYWLADETTWLDNVSLSSVPEPTTLGLLALGCLAAIQRKAE
ncbi:MAG: laminin B domain-containing protein [Phycisphaerales bacterium]